MKENKDISKVEVEECVLEKENLKLTNEAFNGKVEPQNKHHNARKEAYNRDEHQ